jgi:Zn-dependent peptidase ImmA (M78 family)
VSAPVRREKQLGADCSSRLVSLFVKNVGKESDAKSALRRLLVELRRTVGWTRKAPQLERALLVRGIRSTEYKIEWDRDGSLEPLGTEFDTGFRMTLNAKAPKNRVRFTQAHELCHTFFYQYVPEIKFRPHFEDPLEEHLCNFGAAELLMPEYSLTKETKQQSRSLESLLKLASAYSVSPEAMMSRLRSLRLWNGELHIWHREPDGAFVLDRVVGCKWLPWKWSENAVPSEVWARGRGYGHSYLEYEVEPGRKLFKSISFDAKREGLVLMSLSGMSGPEPRDKNRLFYHYA